MCPVLRGELSVNAVKVGLRPHSDHASVARVHDGDRIPGDSSACGQDTKKLPDMRRLNVGPDHHGSLTFNDFLDGRRHVAKGVDRRPGKSRLAQSERHDPVEADQQGGSHLRRVSSNDGSALYAIPNGVNEVFEHPGAWRSLVRDPDFPSKPALEQKLVMTRATQAVLAIGTARGAKPRRRIGLGTLDMPRPSAPGQPAETAARRVGQWQPRSTVLPRPFPESDGIHLD